MTVKVDWVIPYDGSSPITGYIVTIGHNDDITFSEDIVNCNGQEIDVLNAHECNVLISDLIKAPYHHPWGSHIYARVIATNIKGNSIISPKGNDGIILTLPDAPTDLANVPEVTTSA